MIRAMAVAIVCLAGVGVFAATRMKSAPPPSAEIVFPVAAGNKANRLAFSKQEIPANADKVAADKVVADRVVGIDKAVAAADKVVADKAVADPGKVVAADAGKVVETDKVAFADTPPPERSSVTLPEAAPEEAGRADTPAAVHRHEHPRHSSGAKKARHRIRSAEHARAHSPEKPDKEALNAKGCPSDGLRPLLKKLNLVSPNSC